MLFKEVYMVVENPQEKDAGIEIISGEWEGLVYQYGDVQFVDGEPQMNFKRTIRRLPNNPIPRVYAYWMDSTSGRHDY